MCANQLVSRALSEYLLLPGYVPENLGPRGVDLSTSLTKKTRGKNSVKLGVPFLSAAMQSVTGPMMAAALASMGGLGVIYCSQPVEDQARMIKQVKEEGVGGREACLDGKGRYAVGAAINTHDYEARVPVLVEAGADALFVDSSQGFTDYQKKTLQFVNENYPKTPVVGGNVVTKQAFDFLVENGADAVKVGMGSGSICLTQEQIGVGSGQATAVIRVVEARDEHHESAGVYVPIISDGGVVVAKDALVALALGADAVMTGKYLAGCAESPTRVLRSGDERFKPYWGEGSSKAKEWVANRYGQTSFEEGVVGRVPFMGSLRKHLGSALDKIRDGARKAGCKNINDLHEKARLQRLSKMSIREGAVHDVNTE